MSFEEKSAAAVLVATVAVFGWYFARVLSLAGSGPVDQIEYQGLLGVMVVVLVVLAVVMHVVIAGVAPEEADTGDERDRAVAMRADHLEVYVLGAGALLGVGLAMAELEHFWIAHSLLGALVLSEIVGNATKLVLYRRGI